MMLIGLLSFVAQIMLTVALKVTRTKTSIDTQKGGKKIEKESERERYREKIEEENVVYTKLLHERRTRNYYLVYYHTKVNNL